MADEQRNTAVNPFAVGMAGMLVGGAMGAAAVALTDKKNRSEAIRKLNVARNSINQWSDKITTQAQRFSGKTKNTLESKAEELKDKADELATDIKEQTATD